ncbi:MAG: heat shock protein DnaJ domain protein [Nitrospirae bacterium]|nr:heat shock protein DnaJ domain protein [Nitrospirota bacterium]
MLKKIDDMNYYELLEVSYRATAQEIHKAYERVRKIYDPNSIALYSLFSPEETEKIRQRVEDAYRTLIYDENRRDYDLTLRDIPLAPEPSQSELRYQPRPYVTPSHAPRMAEPLAPAPASRAAEPQPQPAAPPPSMPDKLQPVPADISEITGSVLKMMREQRKLTSRNVSDITKLSGRYVECIEEENFKKLPPRPYLRGFLILYAKAIGYEPDRIMTEYLKRYDAAMVPPKK